MGEKKEYDRYNAMLIICGLIGQGQSLVAICKSGIEGVPCYSRVTAWLAEEDGRAERPLQAMYARAREDQADYLADEIIAIADDSTDDELFVGSDDEAGAGARRVLNNEFVQRSKLRIDARKWVAAKLKPRKYGEKIEQVLSNPDGSNLSLTVNFVAPRLALEDRRPAAIEADVVE